MQQTETKPHALVQFTWRFIVAVPWIATNWPKSSFHDTCYDTTWSAASSPPLLLGCVIAECWHVCRPVALPPCWHDLRSCVALSTGTDGNGSCRSERKAPEQSPQSVDPVLYIDQRESRLCGWRQLPQPGLSYVRLSHRRLSSARFHLSYPSSSSLHPSVIFLSRTQNFFFFFCNVCLHHTRLLWQRPILLLHSYYSLSILPEDAAAGWKIKIWMRDVSMDVLSHGDLMWEGKYVTNFSLWGLSASSWAFVLTRSVLRCSSTVRCFPRTQEGAVAAGQVAAERSSGKVGRLGDQNELKPRQHHMTKWLPHPRHLKSHNTESSSNQMTQRSKTLMSIQAGSLSKAALLVYTDMPQTHIESGDFFEVVGYFIYAKQAQNSLAFWFAKWALYSPAWGLTQHKGKLDIYPLRVELLTNSETPWSEYMLLTSGSWMKAKIVSERHGSSLICILTDLLEHCYLGPCVVYHFNYVF